MLTNEEILSIAKNEGIRFIRLQFTDILGQTKNVTIPVKQLKRALEDGIGFDGSSIEGFTRIEESDMLLKPDNSTFTIFPKSLDDTKVARLICDVYSADGTHFNGDPRYVLKKAIAKAESMGFSAKAGPECEFFLFKLDENGSPTILTQDNASYFDLAPLDKGEAARQEIIMALEEMGFEVEASHHENAPGQHEIDFKYDNLLVSADRVATFKFVTKSIAQKHGLHATFMPKPIHGMAGSGMHVNFSLFAGLENAFYDPNGTYQLSPIAFHFIGGLLAHAKGITAIANPLVNSYKRLVTGYEAPVYISWSAANRSALVRVPSSRGCATRLEFRSPDPSCNVYLTSALILEAGLEGIIKKTNPPASVTKNIYSMNTLERQEAGISVLPTSLAEAVAELKNDELIRTALGSHIYERYILAKELEWDEYRVQVHDWELKKYLTLF